jgi:ketosteroid isomerase-like protein
MTPKAGGESKKIYGKMIDIYHKQPNGSWKLFWNAWSDESLVSPSPSEKK